MIFVKQPLVIGKDWTSPGFNLWWEGVEGLEFDFKTIKKLNLIEID